MKCMQEDSEAATALDQLLGIEGNAARIYFENFSEMIKVDDSDAAYSHRAMPGSALISQNATDGHHVIRSTRYFH